MISETLPPSADAGQSFRHEALFYAGETGYLSGTIPFVTAGLAAGEPVWVVAPAARVDLLRDALGADARSVDFSDMAEVGRNPARIIPAWQQFVSRRGLGGRRAVRGIGEPVSAERSPAEVAECHLHESLLNLAFADAPAWRLMCPYDTETLGRDTLEQARRNHPLVSQGTGARANPDYRPHDPLDPFAAPLAEPPARAAVVPFSAGDLVAVRREVAAHAAAAGLPHDRRQDLVMAVNEVATNSLRHGGGRGQLRVWSDAASLVCEVRDRGRIREPLIGRHRPHLDQQGGRGLWLANQVCDLVQLHSSESGSVVRLHMRRG